MENGRNIRLRKRIKGELAKFCELVSFHKGDLIYRPCQHDTKAYLIQRGRVRLYHLERGKRLTLAILGEGDLFGEMALAGAGEWHWQSVAEALEDTICWAIEREKLLAHARPGLIVDLLKLLLQQLNTLQERLKEMAFKDLESRVACTLLRLARQDFELKITHQELAELVGGTRENVTMILNRFEAEGLITKQRFQIAIVDPEGLAERAAILTIPTGELSEN